ncbi:SDR family NAD(P)-dependent oxidoreductase [Streptomyces sp. DG2A-72]|uniref:SDR family NAD(P)-dependent oxidoreductase n=1 Tax=Streptomyces sp. DG2A-72 TaxID=3051386 RepID=UPI00265BE402|nr:SDR family NAD(P)-dependent oxidoreductase [Streptomyces sp. DG2A-72]MDO0930556.1 SDR family NAD(P)-dependent oxidoreductase [Streptomyces sp. DG2A-72]
MNASRIALVTGANQGLGRALVDGLAARMAPDDLVLLTGRSHQRVMDAAHEVTQLPDRRARVEGRVLDVTDTDAITRLADELGAQHGGVDIVISNAIARLLPEESQAERADEFIDVSNTATHTILRSFGPILRPGGRLIVVASTLGALGHLNPRLHHLFDNVSLDQVEYAVEAWRSAIHSGTAAEAGWPRWLNVPSKVAQVAAVRAVAAERREHDLATDTLIASVCPGMVDTATSRPWFSDYSHAQTPARAAGPVLDLVFADRINPALYGELVRFGRALRRHEGTPPVEQDRILTP